ncbi:MAG: carbohydrate binding domain-containing protein, partial [Defluviitaleaceae bacterium]|nr:carbohydrate binding domain-containing protein [Defluviitaleaceae bacterium]
MFAKQMVVKKYKRVVSLLLVLILCFTMSASALGGYGVDNGDYYPEDNEVAYDISDDEYPPEDDDYIDVYDDDGGDEDDTDIDEYTITPVALGDALFEPHTGSVFDPGARSLRFQGDGWNAYTVRQFISPTPPAGTYTFSFWIRGQLSNSDYLGIDFENDENPHLRYLISRTYLRTVSTMEWTQIVVEDLMFNASTNWTHMRIDGHNWSSGSIYLDGFSMREQIGGDPNNLGSNLIRNPGFENGRNYWWAGWDNEQPANFSGGFSLHTWLSADIDDVAILPNASLTDISYDGATISNIVVNIDGTDLDTVTWENFNVSVSGTGLSVANTAAARSWVPAADGYSGVLTLTVVAGANVGSARNGNITVAIGGENDNIAWNQLASPSSGGGHPAPAGMVVSAATRGTPTLTSFNAPIWNGAPVIETGRWKTFGSYTVAPETDAHGAFRVLWDDNYLWVHASVADDTFDISSAGSPWLRDSVEVFMYNGTNIYQIRVCRAETLSGNRIPNNVGYRVQEWPGDDGYDVIIQIPFPSGINAGIGSTFGFDLQVNDADGGTRVAIASVNDTTDTTNSNAAMLGEITLMPAGLTGWFRADALDGSIYSGRAHGMLIDRVANLGVGETDATQDNPPDQPLLVANNPAVNGRPTMRFGGNSFLDVLENNAFNITGEEITIVSLIGNDTGGSRGTIYSKGATVMLEHEWNGPRFVVRTDHSGWPNTWHQPGYNQNVADTAPRVPWHVLTGIHTAANNRIIYTSGSGTSQEWVMPTVQPGNIAHGNMNDSRDRIGAVLYHGSLTGSFAGDIAELMIFNTALTQAELDALNDRFYAKYFDEGGAVVIPTFVTDLVNPGFEMGSTTGWGRMADGDTTTNLTVTNADSNRGRYALEVSNRANAWDTASQDITDLLENLGPGWYDVSAFARYLDFASGTGQVTVRIRCSSIPDADPDWGQRFVGTPIVPIGNTWTEMQGAIYLNWVDLQSAVIYFNPDGGTSAPHPSFRVDDFDIVKTVPNPNFTVAISPGDLTVWDGSEYERSPLQSNDGVSHSLRVYNRTNGSAGPRFNIRELLEVYGPGYYDIGAFIRLEAGSTNGAIMVEIDPAVGANSWITVNGAPVDNTGFTELSGTVNLQWTGALNNAWLYFQSTGGDETANYFMDDITFRRSRGLNYDTSTNVIIYERTDFSGANALNFLSHDNADFSLRVNGMGVPVYQFNQNPATENRNPANTRATLGAFAFEGGSVTVEVTVNVPLHSFRILPTNTGIDVTHRGNTLTFVMDNPRQLMLEINGERDGQLMIFAEPPEPASVRPNPADPNVFVVDTGNITTTSIPPNANVLYFPAGSVTRISGGPSGHPGRLILPTRIHTVFIDGGAVLVGSLFDTGLRENLTIRGRGMLYNGDTAWAGGGNAIRLTGVRYFLFEDLMVIGASYHGIWMENRTILEARNVKIVGPFWWNTDGFQIQGTLGALVEDSFIFGQDDAFCVYNNVILRNNIVGNTQNGAAVAIGFWGFRPISNILVDGLTVLYGQATNIQPMIEILSYNGSPLNDIVIRNVWADNVDAGSFLRLMSDKRWVDTSINTGYSPGMMSDILFENISIDNIGGTIQGFDSMRGVSNVIFN